MSSEKWFTDFEPEFGPEECPKCHELVPADAIDWWAPEPTCIWCVQKLGEEKVN